MYEQWLTQTGRLKRTQPQEIKNQWYIQKFREMHGLKYEYPNFQYSTQKDKINIVCPYHGVFTQSVDKHLRGTACPKCGGTQPKDTFTCIKDFETIHGDTYDYSNVKYINCMTPVDILCKKHGVFPQRPIHHLKGVGCPKCQGHNQNTIYLLKCQNTGLIKIGITNNITIRIKNIGGTMLELYSRKVEYPRVVEKALHDKYKEFRRINPIVISGNTEFFDLLSEQVSDIIKYLESL